MRSTVSLPWVILWPDPPQSGQPASITVGGGAPISVKVAVDGTEVGAADTDHHRLRMGVYLLAGAAGARLTADVRVGDQCFLVRRDVR